MCKPQINVTPLIDVLLVLLIIFMIITPTKPSAFDAKIPQEPDRDPHVIPDPRTIVVAVNADSTLRLNREDMTASVDDPKALIDRLSAIFEMRAQNLEFANHNAHEPSRIEKTVFIKAPRGLGYGSVAKVVDAVKTAGAAPVSLQIDGLE